MSTKSCPESPGQPKGIYGVDDLDSIPGPNRKLNILIMAFKDLGINTRVYRQAKILSERGHNVTVYAIGNPNQELMDELPNVTFIETGRIKLYTPQVFDDWSRKYGSWRQKLARALTRVWQQKINMLINHRVIFAKQARVLLNDRVVFAKRAHFAFKKDSFDAIVVHDHHSMYATLAVDPWNKTTTILDSVEVPYFHPVPDKNKWLRHIDRWVERQCLRRCKYTMTVSNALAKWLIDNKYAKNVWVIRNCRAYEDIVPRGDIRKHAGVKEDQLLGIYLNTVYAGQGVEQMVEALPMMDEKIVLAILGLFSPPEMKEDILALAEKLGVSHRLRILPTVPVPELLPYAAGADFGVIPRQKATINNIVSLPNRVLEMTMAKLPLAVTSIRDIQGVIRDYDMGMVFDETNPQDIADKVNELIRPEKLKHCKENAAKASKRLTWEREGNYFGYIVEQMADGKCAS
ncbi:MAG: glycosyltransferase family 4 protein [Rickettsiales bacterium]